PGMSGGVVRSVVATAIDLPPDPGTTEPALWIRAGSFGRVLRYGLNSGGTGFSGNHFLKILWYVPSAMRDFSTRFIAASSLGLSLLTANPYTSPVLIASTTVSPGRLAASESDDPSSFRTPWTCPDSR